MSRFPALLFCAVLSLIALSGCVPGEDDHVDETRDPNYQRGRSMVLSQDFRGAVDEFEKAIEVNPRSASAHFELAWLNEEKIKDFAVAVYHYEKYLALRPNSEDAQRAKDHITVCKRELAKAEFAPPNTLALQREIDRLNAENLILRQNVDALRTQLSAAIAARAIAPTAPEQPENPQSKRTSVTPIPTRGSSPQTEFAGANAAEVPRGMQPIRVTSLPPAPALGTSTTTTANPHSHIIKPGETLASVAALYHVKLNALVQANPSINPKKLKPGQTVNVPGQ